MCSQGRVWEGEGTVMDQDRHTCTCLPAFLMQDPPFGYIMSPKKNHPNPNHHSSLCCAKKKDGTHYANLKT